jgi:hypothetical protein
MFLLLARAGMYHEWGKQKFFDGFGGETWEEK